jgi:hypothetical protein
MIGPHGNSEALEDWVRLGPDDEANDWIVEAPLCAVLLVA